MLFLQRSSRWRSSLRAKIPERSAGSIFDGFIAYIHFESKTPPQRPIQQTRYVRSHGGKELPLSPIMDPIRVNQRRRHREPKEEAVLLGEPTDFQKQVASNPYVHALATPVRHCTLTYARLPRYFLITFNAKKNPLNNSVTAMVPTELVSEVSGKKEVGEEFEGTGVHLHCRRDVVANITSRIREAPSKALIILRSSGFTQSVERSARRGHGRPIPKWRGDMQDQVKSLLQKVALNKLTWFFKHSRSGKLMEISHLQAVDTAGESQLSEFACILSFDNVITEPFQDFQAKVDASFSEIRKVVKLASKYVKIIRKDAQKDTKESQQEIEDGWQFDPAKIGSPAIFETAVVQGENIPIYHMRALFSEAQIRQMFSESGFQDRRALLLRKGSYTLKAQMALLQLKTYTA